MGRHVGGILFRIKVRSGNCGVPRRLSNNRRRHVIVTHTLLGSPILVLTSRPAKGLSPRADKRVMRLLRSVYHGKATIVVAARGCALMRGCPTHVMGYRGTYLDSIKRWFFVWLYAHVWDRRRRVGVMGRGRDFGI